jgi:hypothetical protein
MLVAAAEERSASWRNVPLRAKFGVDYSEASVAASKRTNARWIEVGRVEVRQASLSQLPGEWTGQAGRCGIDFSAAG